jgi:hypothetical protein
MASKTPEHILQALAFLSAAYPHFKLTRATIAAYTVVLTDLPADALLGAALQLAAEGGDWFPTAGKVRAAAMDIIHADDQQATAQEAWADVKHCIGVYGADKVPEFQSELTARAVLGIGGWRTLCLASMDKDMADRARFIQAYDILVERMRYDQRMLPAVRDLKSLKAGEVRDALADLSKVLALPGTGTDTEE